MNLRLCPTCRRLFPPGADACPDHGPILRDDPLLGMGVCGYQIVGFLADGLYSAVHSSSEAQIAVRVLPPGLTNLSAKVSMSSPTGAGGPLTSRAPEAEVRAILDELRDSNARTAGIGVLPVDGGVLQDGRCCYLFPFSRQQHMEPLLSYLQRVPLSLNGALQLSILLCEALQVAHKEGIYHNALTAESVLLCALPVPGSPAAGTLSGAEVRLLDLGLMRRLSLGSQEQQDPRQDVYGVGAILYQMVTGTKLDSATAFAGAGADLPAEFQAVVLRALAQRKEDRQSSIAALGKDLHALLREAGPTPAPRRRSVPLPLLAAVTLLVAAASAQLIFHKRPDRRPEWWPEWQPEWSRRLGLPGGQPRDTLQVPQSVEPIVESGGGPPARRPRCDEAAADATLVPLSLRAQALDVLSEALRSPSPEARLQAAMIIGQSGDRRLRPLAEELLGDVDERVSSRAAWALGQLGDRAAVVALGQAAGDEKTDLMVGVALVRLSDGRGLPLLRGLLRSKRDSDRLEAALWLGEHGEQEAWRTLRHLLTQAQDEDPLRHLTILGRLCRGRDQAACQQLRERLQQKGVQGQPRLLIGAGLMQAGDQLGYKVLHEVAEDPALRLPALHWLAEGGLLLSEERTLLTLLQPDLPPGEETGQDTRPEGRKGEAAPPRDRAQAAEILGQAAALHATVALGAALTEESPVLRYAAAGALLRMSTLEPRLLLTRAVDWAQASVTDLRQQTRAAAAAVLGGGPPALAVPLLQRALGDREPDVRLAAALALGELQSKGALLALTQALSDREGNVRVAALRSLGLIDDPAATGLLKERLDRGPLLEQVAAAGVLVGKGDLSHRFVLQQALSSPDVAVRRLVLEQAASDPDPAQRSALYVRGLGDAADDVQQLAAVALARMEDRRGASVLRMQAGLLLPQRLLALDALARLKEHVPSLDVMAALGAAGEGQRGAAMVVAPLLLPETGLALVRRGLRDVAQSVRLQAAGAAVALPLEERARQQLLLQLSGDPDAAVQARALMLLSRLLLPEARQR